MRNDNLQQYVNLRRELTGERDQLMQRLAQINDALGDMPAPARSAAEPAQKAEAPRPQAGAKRGRAAAGGGQSLREHVIEVLKSGAKTKEEVLSAVQSRGYKFSTKDPLNSLGVILYGRNPKFNRVDGRFSLSGGSHVGNGVKASSSPSASSGSGKRQMSAAGRAAIAAAARRRWAKARAAGKSRL